MGSETLPSACYILSDDTLPSVVTLMNLVYPFTLRVTAQEDNKEERYSRVPRLVRYPLLS